MIPLRSGLARDKTCEYLRTHVCCCKFLQVDGGSVGRVGGVRGLSTIGDLASFKSFFHCVPNLFVMLESEPKLATSLVYDY